MDFLFPVEPLDASINHAIKEIPRKPLPTHYGEVVNKYFWRQIIISENMRYRSAAIFEDGHLANEKAISVGRQQQAD